MHEWKFYRLGEAQSIEKCLPRGVNGFAVIARIMVFMEDLGFLSFCTNLEIMVFCLTLRKPFYLLIYIGFAVKNPGNEWCWMYCF